MLTTSISLPGRLELENYRAGGEGVGYHDTTLGNTGGAYRTDNVDVAWCGDGSPCYNIGWVDNGEWLAYDVNVAASGSYRFTVRAATPYSGKTLHLEIDGADVTGSLAVSQTGDWHTWADVTSGPITLTAGRHTLRLVAETGGYNLNYVDVTSADVALASQPIALGAFVTNAPWDSAKIDQFTSLVGTAPSIVMWYQNWGDSYSRTFRPALLDAAAARGAMPLITWEPWVAGAGTTQATYSLRAIGSGQHDTYLREWAQGAKAWGKPFYLRPMHEMNGNWYPWCAGVNGNSAADYVAAWRHLVDVFRQEGATNVRWVWSPNVEYAGSTPFAALYPGDAYVDWVALDGYNHSNMKWPTDTWQSFAQLFAPSYNALTALTNKPFMIAETASVEQAGDKAAWIRQGFLNDIPAKFPRVRAVIWFHEFTVYDWRVNSSPASLAAYQEVARSTLYAGRLP